MLHPPPLSYLALFMMPFICSAKAMKHVTITFSHCMFWVENFLFLFAFFVYEIMILPIAYIRVLVNIIRNSMGIFTTILNLIIWLLAGIIIMIFLLCRGISYLIKILSFHQGCRYGKVDELAIVVIDP